VVQDRRNPCEIAQASIADAARLKQVLRENRESAWHKEMEIQAPGLRIAERSRVMGPYLS
jgi:hypothetical protein